MDSDDQRSLEQDAARYRWLKSQARQEGRDGGYVQLYTFPVVIKSEYQKINHPGLDEAIDHHLTASTNRRPKRARANSSSSTTNWISVEERLPESKDDRWSKEVIALGDAGDVFALHCMGTYWQRTEAFVNSQSTKITHWMPLIFPDD
ncbi:TPA: DUF551 domain-containing protein [Salmonella enterica subsp. enterica serovar Javiana]|nr:DUF551 domain-containing protein [Salmonella enterica]EKR2133422.1 DUF551 domain-containing protein [Salmonella enterica subsp. enterica serovar Javiana]EAR6769877.1 DUF551 domain-containing protein [Salmonella enterica]EJP4642306.1 DUF551 domain-containing protein [Salmonella enterica]EJQ1989925.1 DUF551 domain-containing protein [Salmonella enterica]